MLSRYDGSSWGNAIEIKRLNSRSVPTDYQLTMKDDSVLVMMTLKQDVNNSEKRAHAGLRDRVTDNKVRERLHQVEGSKPQMVSVDGTNLVAYLQKNERRTATSLSTVDMKGEPTGKLAGALGMENRMVNDYRLVVDDEATDLRRGPAVEPERRGNDGQWRRHSYGQHQEPHLCLEAVQPRQRTIFLHSHWDCHDARRREPRVDGRLPGRKPRNESGLLRGQRAGRRCRAADTRGLHQRHRPHGPLQSLRREQRRAGARHHHRGEQGL